MVFWTIPKLNRLQTMTADFNSIYTHTLFFLSHLLFSLATSTKRIYFHSRKSAPQQLPTTYPPELMAPIALPDESPLSTPQDSSEDTTPLTPPTPPFSGVTPAPQLSDVPPQRILPDKQEPYSSVPAARVLPEKQRQELQQQAAAMLQRQFKQQPQLAAALATGPSMIPEHPVEERRPSAGVLMTVRAESVSIHPSQSVPNVMAYLKVKGGRT